MLLHCLPTPTRGTAPLVCIHKFSENVQKYRWNEHRAQTKGFIQYLYLTPSMIWRGQKWVAAACEWCQYVRKKSQYTSKVNGLLVSASPPQVKTLSKPSSLFGLNIVGTIWANVHSQTKYIRKVLQNMLDNSNCWLRSNLCQLWHESTLFWALKVTTSISTWEENKRICAQWEWSLHSPPDHHQPQANRGRYCVPAAAAPRSGACFLYFPFISKKEHLILAPTNTDTLLSLWVSFSHSTHPTRASPHTKFPEFPRLACHSHSHPPVCIYPAHALFYPSLWSSKTARAEELEASLYLLHLRPFLPQQPVLCIFHPRGWVTYILSLAPCSHSSPLLHSILLLSHWPQAAALGVAAGLN